MVIFNLQISLTTASSPLSPLSNPDRTHSQPGLLQWTPNSSTPDIVYYQSYTQMNMGWRVVVLDDFNGAAQLLASSGNSGGLLWNAANTIRPSRFGLFACLAIQIVLLVKMSLY